MEPVSSPARRIQFSASTHMTLESLQQENLRLRLALSLVMKKWKFDNNQQPTHTWQDWADCQTAIRDAVGEREYWRMKR